MKEHELKPGDKVGRWVIKKILKNSNNHVFVVTQKSDQKTYVLKQHQYYNRYLIEKEVISRFDHPCLPKLIDHSDDINCFYVVMNHAISNDNALHSEQVINDLIDTYAYIASKGIIPNDADRISNQDRVFLVDFEQATITTPEKAFRRVHGSELIYRLKPLLLHLDNQYKDALTKAFNTYTEPGA